jgi:plastocyanin
MKNVRSVFQQHPGRLAIIVALVAIALFGVYRFAGGNGAEAASSGAPAGGSPAVSTSANAAGNTNCCGVRSSSTQAAGSAQIVGGVQKISVDLSSGSYNPNTLKLKAGVPAEITFGQSSGCTGYVQSGDLGFRADLTSGPQTIKLSGLQPGTYGFACGMGMVTGEIVVE